MVKRHIIFVFKSPAILMRFPRMFPCRSLAFLRLRIVVVFFKVDFLALPIHKTWNAVCHFKSCPESVCWPSLEKTQQTGRWNACLLNRHGMQNESRKYEFWSDCWGTAHDHPYCSPPSLRRRQQFHGNKDSFALWQSSTLIADTHFSIQDICKQLGFFRVSSLRTGLQKMTGFRLAPIGSKQFSVVTSTIKL